MGKSKDFRSDLAWPQGFLELCKAERAGIISTEFQNMKSQAGDDPNHTFPLRDVELQFQVKYKKGTTEESKGSLSYGQLMREAYPGAVYYYATKPHRVYRVSPHRRLVEVRYEKRYTTKPQMMPTLIFPNFTAGNVFSAKKYGDLIVAECNLQIREAILGYKERRGPNEITCNYPLDANVGIFFDQPRFTRNFFTTGVVFSHPAFNFVNVRNDTIANYLFETFLMVIPFERRDLQYGADKHRLQQGPINADERFVCVYDQTYGSLRLSGRIMETHTLNQMVSRLESIMAMEMKDGILEKNSTTALALMQILESLSQKETPLSFNSAVIPLPENERFVKVIKPGSKGLDIKKDNEEFFVEAVFYSPVMQGIGYRGKHNSDGRAERAGVAISIPYESLAEIPGESQLALYDLENGELKGL
jgi:DEAD/DEAH box helicase domain-containing protein